MISEEEQLQTSTELCLTFLLVDSDSETTISGFCLLGSEITSSSLGELELRGAKSLLSRSKVSRESTKLTIK